MGNKIKEALVIQQLPSEGSAQFGQILKARGYEIDNMRAPLHDLSLIDPLEPDIMLVMGGPIGIGQTEEYPFLKTELEIIKKRIKEDKPTMGICLGAQLIASTLGAKVEKGTNGKEIGWCPLTLEDHAKGTVYEHISHEKTNMFHWHGDTFDLPEGATLIASTPNYKNQIFTYGDNVVGFQCHPEVLNGQLQEWFVMFTGQVTGPRTVVPLEKLRADTKEHIETLKTQAAIFFNAWLDERGL